MLLGKKLLVLFSLVGLAFLPSKEQKIKILDEEAVINIHLASKDITGSVGGLKTEVYFDPENLHESFVKATVRTETISTGNLVRDIKLASKRFLNKKKYETINFKSTKIIGINNGYIVEGDLTIKDITRKIAIDAVYSEGVIAGFASINLLDFEIPLVEDNRRENKLDIYIKLRVLKDGMSYANAHNDR